MKAMTLREAMTFGYIVAGLLMLDVVLRALIGGYDAAHIGGFDMALAIAVTVIVVTSRQRARLSASE